MLYECAELFEYFFLAKLIFIDMDKYFLNE